MSAPLRAENGSVCETCGAALTPATIQAMGLCRACHEQGRGPLPPDPRRRHTPAEAKRREKHGGMR